MRTQRFLHPLLVLPRYAKIIFVVFIDIFFCALTVWFAFFLRMGEFVYLSENLLKAIFLSIAVAFPIFLIFNLYRTIFRYSGWPTVLALSRALIIYLVIYGSIIFVIGIDGIPETIGLIQPLLLFFLITISRLLARFWLGGVNKIQMQVTKLPKALIYGAGEAGRQLVSALENSFEMRVDGFLDDDNRLHGHVLNGQPIFSPHDLSVLIETKNITHVLIAIPSLSRTRQNQIIKNISKKHVAVRTLPSVADLANGRVTVSDLRDLDIDDLLERDIIEPNRVLLTKNVDQKTILVTGAGGSIGSELCRQIINLNPYRLLLVDINEYALYEIHAELESMCENLENKKNIQVVPLLASVQDEDRMHEIMNAWQPNTVYHAAAYKHVPLVEHNLVEGIKNNVFGTLITGKIAIEKGVSDFVLISTDKAVRSTNVMGASKRLAELCLQAIYAMQMQKNQRKTKTIPDCNSCSSTRTKFSMVRFGNVMGSSGSVIPRFRKQIRDGGPLTLTHPEITRYFMTIPEAAQLVIQAGAMAKGGDVFVLDMGRPIKIIDLAKRMIELSGFSVRDDTNPDGDIEIVISGLRPGEKLYEELLLGKNPQPTMHSKIKRAQDPFVPWKQLEKDLNKLKKLLNNNKLEMILSLLQKIVSGYQPNKKVVDWVYVQGKKLKNYKK